jgi:hypothetical protein
MAPYWSAQVICAAHLAMLFSVHRAAQFLIGALLLSFVLLGPLDEAVAESQRPLPKLVVLDFDLAGDPGDEVMAAERRNRMAKMSVLLREQIAQSGLYRVLDNAAAQAHIDRLTTSQFLYQCNGCELDIARSLGADHVLVPHVFRVSQLVVTMHVEMKDATTGRLVMKRALDFRNDADGSWERTIAYLLRDMRSGKMWNGEAPH